MASVRSLGLHQPTALQLAIDEQTLPRSARIPSYTWDITSDELEDGLEVEDELLVVGRCVMWSRGGVFRKSFKFNMEKEDIAQALFAYFPTHLDSRHPSTEKKKRKDEPANPKLAKALVVFLKTQAHIHFLAGASHVLHIPFEVESACAGPRGVIIQRKQRTESTAPVSLRFPKVPPNSFVSSQITAPSLRESAQSAFSIEGLGNPKALPMRLSSTLEHMWDHPLEQPDSNWPRLVSLVDPLQEVGLVVTRPDAAPKKRARRELSKTPCFLDPAEEVLHIETVKLPTSLQTPEETSLTLLVTVNRETSKYGIWRLTYIDNGDQFITKKPKSENKPDRRRSSMQPQYASGATTPIQASFRESFGAPLPGKRTRKSERLEKSEKAEKTEKPLDLVSSLDPERDAGAGRRQSRRVSSMLARADLSASQERAVFTEQPLTSNLGPSRRLESHGSQMGRLSGGYGSFNYNNTIHPSLGSLLEAPIDNVLDELRAGGDFEGFHSMGLNDHSYDGLAQEVMLTKIHSLDLISSNVHYSAAKPPERLQSKVFILAAPPFAHLDAQKAELILGIQDIAEQRCQFQIIDIHRGKQFLAPPSTGGMPSADKGDLQFTFGQLRRAHPVIDSCKITDGDLSAILILSEGTDGLRELSLQAPWLDKTPISLPRMHLENERSLHYAGRLVDRDVRQRRSEGPEVASSSIKSLQYSRSGGVVDMVDGDDRHHQIQIQLQPRNALVRRILKSTRSVLSSSHSKRMLPGWWHALHWLKEQDPTLPDPEWSALVVHFMSLLMSSGPGKLSSPSKRSTRSSRRAPSASFGSIRDVQDWQKLQLNEGPNGLATATWQQSMGWDWTIDDDDEPPDTSSHPGNLSFLSTHVRHTQAYLAAHPGSDPSGVSKVLLASLVPHSEYPAQVFWNLFITLHLILEEEKLNVMVPEHGSPGSTQLRLFMAQVTRWLKWHDFAIIYELGIQEEIDPRHDDVALAHVPPQPSGVAFEVIEWIRICLTTGQRPSFLTITGKHHSESLGPQNDQTPSTLWDLITPRTLMFQRFFERLSSQSDAIGIVEAMHNACITPRILDTLPEAILAPLRDAISKCQSRPPASWNEPLLELVNRTDISQILKPNKTPQTGSGSILTPTHKSSWDFHTICLTLDETNSLGPEDGDGSERQAVIRALFKEDRRLNEAQDLLSTHRPRVVQLLPEHGWTESEYLEKQKALVSVVAGGTLAIPAGRALLYFSLKFPLLTQKLHIGGFNLNCIVRPTNVTVSADKANYTEEKVCWGFFHQGVAAGLAISPQAKGIDTSWILYNKPGQELSNRHAGFLLALGLNGHLRDVAKWVAFKYLTPKHTMTSIGLLLGLAASYLGTMDSLITRLLSVHVTRMLPRGAAELNISPLTQTTGIMGIGLLYCESQHRRMSEIMMSEIEHVDEDDEPDQLRSECYRLAAGFSLGFINLGKGNDLKGLHDMRLTEKLITIATTAKKVEMVHVLDRSAAGAVMALTLIFMKSEDHIVARKIDVPESIVQFDYVRPDILLLRTVAKNLILWSKIEPSYDWVFRNLPKSYRFRHRLNNTMTLQSTDLPFFSIVAGLCMSLALRFAGSGSIRARDLLIHYLDQFMRIAQIPPTRRPPPFDKPVYDEELARTNARMCQDVLALSVSIVMAGTGDLVVLRRLRSLHGRVDEVTPYGSHLAAHLAIGALFLGCGTTTFGTSNLAIASLLVAFYPIFPSKVGDNRSHLQAFRHFWVLATDARCLVTKDVATGQPISVPVHIKMKNPSFHTNDPEEEELVRTTPCLLPPLCDVKSLRTNAGPSFWDVELDMDNNPLLGEAMAKNRSLFLRRRPPQEAPFAATLRALGRDALADATHEGGQRDPLDWVFNVPALGELTHAERALVLDRSAEVDGSGTAASAVDARLVLERSADGSSRERLQGLKLLFEWADVRDRMGSSAPALLGESAETLTGREERAEEDGNEWWLRDSTVELLKGQVFLTGRDE
ncbi:hypothetical protein F5X68DRAFT_160130, partial [Plectosphaerella plurivora]